MIEVYSKHGCPFCDKIKSILSKYKINHKTYELGEDYTREDIIKKLGEALNEDIDKFTYPVVFEQSQYIGGCDDTMDYLLEKRMV